MIRYEIGGADDVKTIKARLRVNTVDGRLQVELMDRDGDWSIVAAFDPEGYLALFPIADRIPGLMTSCPGNYVAIRR
jgi:hypothetical protein